jgi:hypothetical protein
MQTVKTLIIMKMNTVGIQFLENIHGWPLWKQTSYNTQANVHALGGTPFRKNYAGIGYTYDEDRDAFIPPKPYASWVVNETTCVYEAPVAYPSVTTYNTTWTQANIDANQAPDGTSAGDARVANYEISWDEANTRWICQRRQKIQSIILDGMLVLLLGLPYN